ncbi:hypothetical protein KIN20_005428 [Parelaphostrongylus tenuis]|uniref:Uncharacterized protein n=1 Tax=Parelaphostrongylus tenuis TaxID=148309 RepID=A0AAD5MII6_PARTN|nr:hypothetical protein KIN20_005428 [Parelaphostrongylus tenuis]
MPIAFMKDEFLFHPCGLERGGVVEVTAFKFVMALQFREHYEEFRSLENPTYKWSFSTLAIIKRHLNESGPTEEKEEKEEEMVMAVAQRKDRRRGRKSPSAAVAADNDGRDKGN